MYVAGRTSFYSINNTNYQTLETCFALGIKEVSVYAFSIENFKRPKEEVDEIHRLIRDNVCKIIETDVIEKHRVRINFVGNRALIAPDILSDFERFEEKTNTAEATNILNICFAYTARDEIAHSVQQVAAKREAQVLAKSDICESHITENLYVGTSGSPLDLLVRTSGETRLSDFLLWQCTASCQIVYLDVLWPRMSFLDLYLLFLGWSYSQIMVHDRRITWALPKSTASVQLRMLPASPPFASVTGEKK